MSMRGRGRGRMPVGGPPGVPPGMPPPGEFPQGIDERSVPCFQGFPLKECQFNRELFPFH